MIVCVTLKDMTATAHALVGTVIAAKIGNPALAIPIAIASHVVTDAIPHWDTGSHRKEKTWNALVGHTFLDVVLGFILSFLLIYFIFPGTSYIYAFVMIIAAQSFDWLTAPYYFLKYQAFKPFYRLQKSFENEIDKPWGIITQVATVVILVALAKMI